MNFATLHFDTYKVVNLLMGKGYSKDEAEGFIEAIQEVTLSGVATKQDIDDLKEAMNELRLVTKKDIDDLRLEMTDFKLAVRQDIDDLRSEIQDIKSSIKTLEARLIARIYGGQIASVVAVIGALKFFGLL